LGGLSKKAFQIQTITENSGQQRLLLDSGNLLFKREKIADGPNQERLTAEAIMTVYQKLAYDAVGVGPLDLSGGLDFIRKSSGKEFPWVSANIIDEKGQPIFKQWIRKKISSTEIVITALTARPRNPPEGIKIEKWQTILPELLTRMKAEKNDPFIIVLSSLNYEENRKITEKYPEIHLLISADQHKGNLSPQLINGCLITQTSKQGKYQGLLEINLGKKREWGADSAKLLADLQNRKGSLDWQLRRLQKKIRLTENKEKYKNTLTRISAEKEQLNEQITNLKQVIEKEQAEGIYQDKYKYRFIGLKKNLPNDTATADLLSKLNQEIRQLHKKSRTSPKTAKTTTIPHNNMVGFSLCATCHPVQTDFWKTTDHASAYATLVQNEKQLDLECLPCHLTLNMQRTRPGRMVDKRFLYFPEELQSVGCESCHGAGKQHSQSPEKFKLVRLPSKNICLACHTPDHDDNFEYENKLLKVSCPAG